MSHKVSSGKQTGGSNYQGSLQGDCLTSEGLAALLSAFRSMTSSLRLNEVLRSIMQEAALLLDAEGSSVLLLDKQQNELYFEVAQGEKGGRLQRIRVPLEGSLAGWIVRNCSPLISNDVASDPRHFRQSDKQSSFVTRNLIGVPMTIRDEVIGVVEVVNRRSNRHFTEEDLSILESIAAQAAVAIDNAQLYQKLESSYMVTVQVMAGAIEARDPYTQGHSDRVAAYSLAIASHAGLESERQRLLLRSALLHDVGKIGIADAILGKPARLTAEEYEMIKQHPAIGRRILAPAGLEDEVISGVFQHHERLDGTGYPSGLAGKDIGLFGRIIALADTFDAMTSERAYRRALADEEALSAIKKNAGVAYDPQLVQAFSASYQAGEIERQSRFRPQRRFGVLLTGRPRAEDE